MELFQYQLQYSLYYVSLFLMETIATTKIKGHLAATVCILIWGVTFISSKVLLTHFSPTELFYFRFLLAYIFLFILSPKPVMPKANKTEILYALSGLTGVSLYFMLQNTGLQYTLASNAGVLVSVAPMFTAIVAFFLVSRSSLHKNFILGFFVSIAGVAIISFNGNFVLQLNPLGDFLIIVAALSWGFYSNILTMIEGDGLSLVQRTRKAIFYGLLFVTPLLPLLDFRLGLERFDNFQVIGNFLFLGIGASAISFVAWGYAVKILGPVKASAYIYFNPIITVVASIIILHEPFTWISFLGTALIIVGLLVAEGKRSTPQAPEK